MYPLTFEAMGVAHGFVLYETMINETFSDPAKLEIPGIRDRGYVFVDGESQVQIMILMETLVNIAINI
jgi:hypothetical protein